MGIYFIAAGTSSKNRSKSLDSGFFTEQLRPHIPTEVYEKLVSYFKPNQPIYAWGANDRSLNQLNQVSSGEPVVDVKNKKVMQIFEFCFYYKTHDTSLQEFIGWDSEKPREKRRPYRYVFFLKNPQKSIYTQKDYFAEAFDQTHNQNWLVGQRYFSDKETDMAMIRKGKNSVDELLGLTGVVKDAEMKIDKTAPVRKVHQLKSTQKQVIIKENQTGISFEKLFGPYLNNVSKITLVDPYIRQARQFKYFMEFAHIIAEHKPADKKIDFKLLTRDHKDSIPDFEKRFKELAYSLKSMNIEFSYEYDSHIHDRHIQLDNGWKIILGRGLDIFHRNSSRYNIAELSQKLRKCKACEITYLKKD